MNNNLAPIVLFVYNRLWHTQKTIEALQHNNLARASELYIYSDAAKNKSAQKTVSEVRDYINNVGGFKKVTIINRDKNFGLARSIIDGVTTIVNQYGKIIVLEDDLVTSPCFLTFMNKSLNVFEDRKDVFSITGFNYPESVMEIPKSYKDDIYLSYRGMSWSWGVWKDRWGIIDWKIEGFEEFSNNKENVKLFNRGGSDLFPMLKKQLEGKIDSWAIRFCYAHYKNNSFCVYPTKSFVNNVGFDGSGVHCGNDITNRLANSSLNKVDVEINKDISPSNTIIALFYNVSRPSVLRRVKSFIRRVL